VKRSSPILKTALSLSFFGIAVLPAAFADPPNSNSAKLNLETPTSDATPIPATVPAATAEPAAPTPSATKGKGGKTYKLGSQLQGGVEQKIVEPLDALKKIDSDAARLNNQAKSLYHESTKDTASQSPGQPSGTVGIGFVIGDVPTPTFDPGYFPPNPYKVSKYVSQIETLTADLQQDLDTLNVPAKMLEVVHPQVQEIKKLMDIVEQHKANLHGLQKSWDLNNAMLAGEAEGIQFAIKQIKKDTKVIKDVIQGKPPSDVASSS
jgi:hypothetical protein